MATGRHIAVLLILLGLVSESISRPIIQTTPENPKSDQISDGVRVRSDSNSSYCESWRYSIETNDAGYWSLVPARCEEYVKEYMTGGRFLADLEVVADDAVAFAKTVNVSGDGKDAWVFDIDDTLLSSLPYYATIGYGTEEYNETTWDDWVFLAEAPVLPPTLKLYKELQQLGFTIFLLTGRDEDQRNVTVKNLQDAGFSNWEKLILRGPTDSGTKAIVYKSEKRNDLKDEGYVLHGSAGDQWSDLSGFAIAKRSFKIPNPLYYIA